MPKFLLHICCAICSGYVIDQLKKDFDLTAYFYNPNIHPETEYIKRKEAVEMYCLKNKINFIEGYYDNENWFKKTKGLENEPECGKRCDICYDIRLEQTAKVTKQLNCEYFGSTLTISPHKKADIVNPIGVEAGNRFGIKFYEFDWKKQDGFKKTNEISKKERVYRQNYCGCIYSVRGQ